MFGSSEGYHRQGKKGMLDTSKRIGYDESHAMFRESVRRFFSRELLPNTERWERDRICDRDFWRKAGAAGLLCPIVPEQYGGPGLDFTYNAIVAEELAYAGSPIGFALRSDINCGYLLAYGTHEQKTEYLPRTVSGKTSPALA
jgi:acyl-CoA dehydrogenase